MANTQSRGLKNRNFNECGVHKGKEKHWELKYDWKAFPTLLKICHYMDLQNCGRFFIEFCQTDWNTYFRNLCFHVYKDLNLSRYFKVTSITYRMNNIVFLWSQCFYKTHTVSLLENALFWLKNILPQGMQMEYNTKCEWSTCKREYFGFLLFSCAYNFERQTMASFSLEPCRSSLGHSALLLWPKTRMHSSRMCTVRNSGRWEVGCLPQGMLGYTPPPRGQNDRRLWKYYLAAT